LVECREVAQKCSRSPLHTDCGISTSANPPNAFEAVSPAGLALSLPNCNDWQEIFDEKRAASAFAREAAEGWQGRANGNVIGENQRFN